MYLPPKRVLSYRSSFDHIKQEVKYVFIGTSFSSGNHSFSNTAAADARITSFVITKIILDEMYATKNLLIPFDWNMPKDWDFNTLLHGLYQGDTNAGNVSYTEEIVSKVKIKKRFAGDFVWTTIYEKNINVNEDFNFEFYDYYEPSNRDIEYAYVAVIAGSDSDTFFNTVHSRFHSYFLCGKDISYPMILDTSNDITYNRESNIIVSPGRKYPYVVHNGMAHYYSGTLKATFIEPKNCRFDTANGWKYRNQLDRFLTDGSPKILKSFEGDMWMVNISGSLPRTQNGHYQNISHQIEWVECGDPTLIGDLYDNGFIDTDIDRENNFDSGIQEQAVSVNYNELYNKPVINGEEVVSEKTLNQYGLYELDRADVQGILDKMGGD